MFGFIEIELLRTQNITIPKSINSVTIPQKYIFHLLCDLSSVWQVWCLLVLFHDPLFCNNYFPVFYLRPLLIIKMFTYFIFSTSASVLHISVKLFCPYQTFGWKYHQSCPFYSSLTIHELIINNFSTCFKAKWYNICL